MAPGSYFTAFRVRHWLASLSQLGVPGAERLFAGVHVLDLQSGLVGFGSVSAGSYYSLAVRSNGTVWAWGDNSSGELGAGTGSTHLVPVQVQGLSGVGAVATGDSHSLAMRSDGTVWAWGDNSYGQLGSGLSSYSTTVIRSLLY